MLRLEDTMKKILKEPKIDLQINKFQLMCLDMWANDQTMRKKSFSAIALRLGTTKIAVYRAVRKLADEGILAEDYTLTVAGAAYLERFSMYFSAFSEWLCRNGFDRRTAQNMAYGFMADTTDAEKNAMMGICLFLDDDQLPEGRAETRAQRCIFDAVEYGRIPKVFHDKPYPIEARFYRTEANTKQVVRTPEGAALSMADSAFLHPASLVLRGGRSFIVLHRVPLSHAAYGDPGQHIAGKLKTMEYDTSEQERKQAEIWKDEVYIPTADILWEKENEGLLRGELAVTCTCTAGQHAMPKSTAVMELSFFDRQDR